jgi:hypothetical protein
VPDALIGYTGYIGSTLLRQKRFQFLYRSTNISEISHTSVDLVVCAGAPAQKWIANREPDTDRETIERLIQHLEMIKCRTFVLISTVDVFKIPVRVNERTSVDEEGLHPYGKHRRLLERFVEAEFPQSLIVRLPGVVGPGLRKNAVFDLLNENNLDAVDSRGIFQFYPMVNLWYDIGIALEAGLELVHFTSEPISVAELAQACFGRSYERILPTRPAAYDFQSNHAGLFGGRGAYQYSKRETIQAVRAYAQSEPVRTDTADRPYR